MERALCLNRFLPVRSATVARRRPSRTRPGPSPRQGFLLLVVGDASSYPLELGPAVTRLPSGAEVRVIEDWVQLRVARPGVTVNDVEVHGSTALHPGDVLADGEFHCLVLPRGSPVSKAL